MMARRPFVIRWLKAVDVIVRDHCLVAAEEL
jgi:hypothetical protein